MKAVLFLAGLLLATAGVVVPAAAQNYPWCAQYSGGDAGGGRNCGFSTFAQCLADVSGIGGFLTIRAVSRSTTTGTGIAVGEVSTALYTLAYQNIAGTVSLPAAGPTLVTSQTTVAALTVPTVTATASGNVITILVSNVSLCTVDSTCYLDNYTS